MAGAAPSLGQDRAIFAWQFTGCGGDAAALPARDRTVWSDRRAAPQGRFVGLPRLETARTVPPNSIFILLKTLLQALRIGA
jgi:hypothetical protein